ncbi:MAG: tetraacyldisaccharide 4'-kinase [Rhodobacteraceae bacterium]|nr:tetraacyldisaccharide 4'-kinase [Paracoccaceae bacterium]
MIAPEFWYHKPGRRSAILAPVSLLWSWATALRLRRRSGFKFPVPVVCVGNISVGGSGKTPVVMALSEHLHQTGWTPGIVTRGYRGRLRGPVEVDVRVHTADAVGDEPLVLASQTRTWKSVDRRAGVRAAMHAGSDIIVLDDGHQSPSPPRDLSLLVVNARTGFGNGRVIPAGPLRETIRRGLARADMLIVIGQPATRNTFLKSWRHMITIPVLTGRIETLQTGLDWSGMQVYGFAGIAHPEKFRRSLLETGAEIMKFRPLADHQNLDRRLLMRMEAEAAGLGAQLVTTEKDAARLPSGWRQRVLTLPVRFRMDSWQPVETHLAQFRKRKAGTSGPIPHPS